MNLQPQDAEPVRSESDRALLQHLVQVEIPDALIDRWKSAVRETSVGDDQTENQVELPKPEMISKGAQLRPRWIMLALATSILISLGAWSFLQPKSLESLERGLMVQMQEFYASEHDPFLKISAPSNLEMAPIVAQLRVGEMWEGRWLGAEGVQWNVIRIRRGNQVGFICSTPSRNLESFETILQPPMEQNSGTWKMAHCRSEDHLIVFVHQGDLSNWLRPRV